MCNNTTPIKRVLVSGGAGFIGSNFVPYFCAKYPQYNVINLDKLTYAGNLDNVKECESMPNYTFIKEDICIFAIVNRCKYSFSIYCIEGKIKFDVLDSFYTHLQRTLNSLCSVP